MKLLITDYLCEAKKLGVDIDTITFIVNTHSTHKSKYLSEEQVEVITDLLLPMATSTRYDINSFLRGISNPSHKIHYHTEYIKHVV